MTIDNLLTEMSACIQNATHGMQRPKYLFLGTDVYSAYLSWLKKNTSGTFGYDRDRGYAFVDTCVLESKDLAEDEIVAGVALR